MIIYLLGLVLWLPATIYYGYAIFSAIAFCYRASPPETTYQPPLTILKPVCGLDQDTYKNFASFCTQAYPQYQIIFAVRAINDPVMEIVKQIINDFPNVDIQLVQSDRLIGTNYKISNLANALPFAKHEILVLADSDVQVTPTYLSQLVQPLANLEVGAVTCLYRPITDGWVAKLEAVGITTDYLASVLVANQLEGIKFALGPTIALRQSVLAEIGGFEAIADYLADDYQIGYLISQLGYKVVLSGYIIQHLITTNNFQDLLDRQLRWAYCTKVSRTWGYLGLVFTQGIATSLVLLMLSGGRFWQGLAIALTLRMLLAVIMGSLIVKDRTMLKFLWLVPIRDLVSFGIWMYSWFANTINWRGRKLKLDKLGKLQPN